LYNILHGARTQTLDREQPSLQGYKQVAEAVTRARRERFDKVRKQYWSLPSDKRVPHFIDE
jgi:hypothetical protein